MASRMPGSNPRCSATEEPAVAAERRFAEQQDLAAVVRAGLGPGHRLTAVERVSGGTKKGVYRLTLDDDSTVIGYVWAAAENYWPQQPGGGTADLADPFSDASGSALFEASHACLDALGVRVPQIFFLDRSRAAYPDDIALVEDVRGGSLEAQLARDRPGGRRSMALLDDALQAMHQHRGLRIGKLAWTLTAAAGPGRSCEQIVLDRALGDLDEAARRVPSMAAARRPLAAIAGELCAAVLPRAEYGLIHGELGPDHVLIDDHGHPVIIDIEGVMFFDVEWEHVYLIAGPLRLLDGDFPDRVGMLEIAEYNTARALGFVR
jgi:hypothetical protein